MMFKSYWGNSKSEEENKKEKGAASFSHQYIIFYYIFNVLRISCTARDCTDLKR